MTLTQKTDALSAIGYELVLEHDEKSGGYIIKSVP